VVEEEGGGREGLGEEDEAEDKEDGTRIREISY